MWRRCVGELEPPNGFEPLTCCLRNSCSTPELRWSAHEWLQQFRSQNADEPTALSLLRSTLLLLGQPRTGLASRPRNASGASTITVHLDRAPTPVELQRPVPVQRGRYQTPCAIVAAVTPLYSDTPRFSLFTVAQPVIAGVLLYQGVTGGGALPILFGLGLGLFYLYKRPTRYDLFQDALVIRYRIRTMVVPLSDVQGARLGKMPLSGQALLIQRRSGGPLVITPKDPDGFLSRLEAGLRTSEEPPQP